MADKKLESITFPDLPDRYVVKPDIADVTGLQTALDGKADVEDFYNAFVKENLTGSIASFDDGADDIPVKSLVAEIAPVQSGSGDPSPDNVRPITGWTKAEIHVADGENPHIVDNVKTINWQSQAGTVYGGSIDVTSGVLTVDSIAQTINGGMTLYGNYGDYNKPIFYIDLPTSIRAYASQEYPEENMPICNRYTANTDMYVPGMLDAQFRTQGAQPITPEAVSNRIYIRDDRFSTAEALNSDLASTPAVIVGKLATPQTYQLTPTEVKTLLGNNNVWADTGDIDLTYRADLGLYLDKIINA